MEASANAAPVQDEATNGTTGEIKAGADGLPQSPSIASPQAGATSNVANHVDIKVFGIDQLPTSWTNDSGAGPMYPEHVFRYEVDVAIDDEKHTFKNGRLLQRLPMYTDFIDQAEPPSAVEVKRGENEEANTSLNSSVQQQDVPCDVAGVPVPDTGLAKEASMVQLDDKTPPGILWVIAPELEADIKEEPTAKKDTKPAGKKAPATKEAAPQEVQKPIAPSNKFPPTCVCRLPIPYAALDTLESNVEKGLPLTLTLRRVLRPNCPADWEDASEQRYQAKIPISLKELAEPGTTTMRITVPLEALHQEVKEDDKSKKKAAPKKAKGAVPACLTEELDPSEPHPYTAFHTTCDVMLTFQSPLTRLAQHRPRPDLAPGDMIPRRLKPPHRPVEATKQYTREVSTLIQKILRDYRAHVQQNNLQLQGDEARASFLNHLATSGQAHAYREGLVPSVQGIVKEKMLRKTSATKEELDNISNELYTYLIDHLHLTMNRAFSRDTRGRGTAEDGDAVERWRRLAMEAEVMQEYSMAAKYHQERLVQCRPREGEDELPDVWSEYAEFCLRTRDMLKAEQGYREALALDLAHLPSLIGYGALLLCNNRFKEAEVFLQSAVDTDGSSLTWGCIALHYTMLLQSLPESPEDSELETKKSFYRREGKYAMSQAVRTSDVEGFTSEDVWEQLARHLLDLHQEELVNACLSKCNQTVDVSFLTARLYKQTQQYDESVAILEEVLKEHPQNAEAHMLLGDVYCLMQNNVEAEQHYGQALQLNPDCGTGPAYIRLGNMYVALGKYKEALSVFTMGVKVWPCGLTWLGMGIAYYRLEDIARAEQALSESNIQNNLNPKTWAFLSLVCLRTKREEEGDQAFNQAVKQGLDNAYLIAEVGAEQMRLGRMKIAEACFRRALTHNADDCNTRMLLGKALSAMRMNTEAKEEYAKVAKLTTNDTLKAKAEDLISTLS